MNNRWKLVWSDEFDDPILDRGKWGYEITGSGCGNSELQYYTDRIENACVINSCLVIRACKESFSGPDGGRDYTSARLSTKGKMDWRYGRFEARMKLPAGGKGIWPAFWMMPVCNRYGTWPRSGEIDIMEMIGNKADVLHGTLHYSDQFLKHRFVGGKMTLEDGRLGDHFHIYAIEWEEAEIRWYFDGQNYHTETGWWNAIFQYPAPFDESFYILINLAVGGNWPGDPADTTIFPQMLEIDYIRVYQSEVSTTV